MARAFADITFTPSVKSAQERYGSRNFNLGFEESEEPFNTLGENEISFITARDSFYMGTVNEKGWPYVQHRGGPAGFIKVLDDRTIGFADFRGNRQYLSVGNLNSDDRISLILMDYPNKTRLKLWGRVQIIHSEDDPELMAVLEVPTYRARVERGMLISVEAIEWNCPQHITPRYTENEVDEMLRAERRLGEFDYLDEEKPPLGDGPLALTVTCVRQLTPRVRGYRLEAKNGQELPAVKPGAHIKVPVVLEDGSETTRSYSICSDTQQRQYYDIAVLCEEQGRGGSRSVHQLFTLEQTLNCQVPENHFALHEDNRAAVLIAGGIGITPIYSMARALKKPVQTPHLHDGYLRDFHLHYAARSRKEMSFVYELQQEFGEQLSLYHADENNFIDLTRVLCDAPEDAVFYVCGPQGLLSAVQEQANVLGIDDERIRFEQFSSAIQADDQEVSLTLAKSKVEIVVPADETLLQAITRAGIDVPYSCEAGNCKTCAVTVLDGEVDHRDAVLSQKEKNNENLMCPCVSRALTPNLTLNI